MLFLCFVCALFYGAWGALCQNDFSVMVMLDKDSDNTVKYGAPQIDGMNWRIDVDYDTMSSVNGVFRYLRGVVSCSEYVGNAKRYTALTDNRVMPAEDIGAHCWCALRRPATTYFMFLETYDSVDACLSGCAKQCANGVVSSFTFRNNLFEAIW